MDGPVIILMAFVKISQFCEHRSSHFSAHIQYNFHTHTKWTSGGMAMYINHVNYANEIGNVYCCLRNKVVELNQFQIDNFCSGCKMFKGGGE